MEEQQLVNSSEHNLQVPMVEDCSAIIDHGNHEQESNNAADESMPRLLDMVPTSEGLKSPISSILSPKDPQIKKKPAISKPKSRAISKTPTRTPPAKPKDETKKKIQQSPAKSQNKEKCKETPDKSKSLVQAKKSTNSVRAFRLLFRVFDTSCTATKLQVLRELVGKNAPPNKKPKTAKGASSLIAKKETGDRMSSIQTGPQDRKSAIPEPLGWRSSLSRTSTTVAATVQPPRKRPVSKSPYSSNTSKPKESSLSPRGRSLPPVQRKPFIMLERVFTRRRKEWLFKFFRFLEKRRVRSYHLLPDQQAYKTKLFAGFLGEVLTQFQLRQTFSQLRSETLQQSEHLQSTLENRSKGAKSADVSTMNTGDKLLVSILKHRGNARINSSFLWSVYLNYFFRSAGTKSKQIAFNQVKHALKDGERFKKYKVLSWILAFQHTRLKVGFDCIRNYEQNLRTHKLVRFLNIFALQKMINVVRPVFDRLGEHVYYSNRIRYIKHILKTREVAIQRLENRRDGIFCRVRKCVLELKLAIATIKKCAVSRPAKSQQLGGSLRTSSSSVERRVGGPPVRKSKLQSSVPVVVFESAKPHNKKPMAGSGSNYSPKVAKSNKVLDKQPLVLHTTVTTKTLQFKPFPREAVAAPVAPHGSTAAGSQVRESVAQSERQVVADDSQELSDVEDTNQSRNPLLTHAPSADGLSISTIGEGPHPAPQLPPLEPACPQLFLSGPGQSVNSQQLRLTLTVDLVKEISQAYQRGLGRFPTVTVSVPASIISAPTAHREPVSDEEMLIDNGSPVISPRPNDRPPVPTTQPLLGKHHLVPVFEDSKESDLDDLMAKTGESAWKEAFADPNQRIEPVVGASDSEPNSERFVLNYQPKADQSIQSDPQDVGNSDIIYEDHRHHFETIDSRLSSQFASQDPKSHYSSIKASGLPKKKPSRDYLGVKKESRILRLLLADETSSKRSAKCISKQATGRDSARAVESQQMRSKSPSNPQLAAADPRFYDSVASKGEPEQARPNSSSRPKKTPTSSTSSSLRPAEKNLVARWKV